MPGSFISHIVAGPDRAEGRCSRSSQKHAGPDSVHRNAGADARPGEQVTQLRSLGLGELERAQALHPIECLALSCRMLFVPPAHDGGALIEKAHHTCVVYDVAKEPPGGPRLTCRYACWPRSIDTPAL